MGRPTDGLKDASDRIGDCDRIGVNGGPDGVVVAPGYDDWPVICASKRKTSIVGVIDGGVIGGSKFQNRSTLKNCCGRGKLAADITGLVGLKRVRIGAANEDGIINI